MFYATACYLHSSSPKKTAEFLVNTLGFEILSTDPIPLLSNGSLSLRLVRGETPAILELQCSNIEADSQALLQYANMHKCTEIVRHKDYLEQHLYCDVGITLILIKPLSEDDNNALLPLPTALFWHGSLIEKAQYILKSTPLAFREKARQSMVEKAEYLAVDEGGLEALEHHVMQAFVQITPPFQHQTLFESMKAQGIDADKYLDRLSWDEAT
ncbi:MAG: hypothetical protein COB41_01350 [Proteobacteria bacterium]|nr:MAG: hypothetical protein COB41_01350 [Pseudomonadota bacterium]